MLNTNNPTTNANQEVTHWMRFDNKTFGTEDNIASNLLKSSGYGYRKVHYTEEVEQNKAIFGLGKDKIFFDRQWDIRAIQNLNNLDPNNPEKIVLRRLGHLYPTNQLRPKFFPDNDLNEPLRKVKDLVAVPHFLHELGVFPQSYYKSLFFTQDFQASGMYHAVVNYNGRWETDVVDDFIPVYEKSGRPIWGMDLQQPWQLILLKFWAKRNLVHTRDHKLSNNGGYEGVKNAAPFDFINTFSNSNWKFVNFNHDLERFLRTNVNRVHKGHFILKTKNSSHVKESGLIPGQACYELINLVEQGQARSTSSGIKETSPSKLGPNNNKKGSYIATIRSSNKIHWAGKKSVIDPEFKQIHKSIIAQHKHTSRITEESTVNDKNAEVFGLDRCFTIDANDLGNLFSACYITTRRLGGDSISSFYKFTYPANRKKAMYLEFEIPAEGFLDFSLKQLPSNKIAPSQKSKIKTEEYNKQFGGNTPDAKVERYLRNKYILVKDNFKSEKTFEQENFQKSYNPLHYETYEIQYLKGYNSGDAHFLRTVKGRYILRIKSETIPRDAHFVINYCSDNELFFKPFEPTRQEQNRIMKDAMSSTIDKVKRITLRQKDESEVVAYGNQFQYIGYGYVGVKLKKTSKMQVLIDVDPEQLKNQGYKLKHLYKTETKPFAVVVNPGESTAIVLKKINEQVPSVWPPKGIAIFQK